MSDHGMNGAAAPSGPGEKPPNLIELFDRVPVRRRTRKAESFDQQHQDESRFRPWLRLTAYVLIALTALYAIWGLVASLSR